MLPTGTVTFLFTDIQGSTSLWEREPEKMASALQLHNAALRQAIETHAGVVFKVVGDEFQAAFPTAQGALRAAIAGQLALGRAAWNELGELAVRMGLHTGEAELDPAGDEYAVSHTKNRAARIMSAAHGRQILLSKETASLVFRELPEQVSLEDLGQQHLKGLATPEHIYQVCAPELPHEFPPFSAAISPPHNLPIQLTSFIGRTQEIAEISELLEHNRLVTLLGSGGTGKTRLALRVAEALLETFPHGVWHVELAELGNPELVPRTIAAALGTQENPNRSPPDQLKDYLREKELLIILDNCEHLINECARITETLLQACPKLKIMVSSREALGVSGEIIYQVPTLSVPDTHPLPLLEKLRDYSAVRLFTERAAAINTGFEVGTENAQSVAKICQRLDGIPLAIELAAARISSLSVEQIAARLDNRFRLLTAGSRTAVPRQQTLRASIDWSYSLLDESEKLLLMRLSVFHGGWTLELGSEVCGFEGLDEFDVLDGLSQLVNKSLIQSVSGPDGSRRYRQLETIREYGREKLFDSGTSAILHNRHLDAFAHLVATAEPHLRDQHQVEWLDRLEVELDNLRTALEWALVEDPQKGLRMATAMFWFWNNRGPRVEGESWLRQLQEHVEEETGFDRALLATARARQGHLQLSIGELGKQVFTTAMGALELAEQLAEDGKLVKAMALWVMAISKKHLGYNIMAQTLGRECLEIAAALGDRFMIAESYELLMDIEYDPTNARHFAEKHLALRLELGDLDGQMIAHYYMAINEFWSGDLVKACKFCKQGMEIASIVKNPWGLVEGNSILGSIFRITGQADRAIDHLQRALAIVHDTGEPGRVVRQLNVLGCGHAAKRTWQQAERNFQQAIHIARNHHFALWEVISHINLAETAYSFNQTDLALAAFKDSQKVDRSGEYKFLDGLIRYGSGKAALFRDDLPAASESFQQALEISAEIGDRKCMNHSLQALAVCAVHSGKFERAVRLRAQVETRKWLLWPTSMPWLVPFDLEDLLSPARSTLGEQAYARIYAQGQAMTPEEALAYALEAPK